MATKRICFSQKTVQAAVKLALQRQENTDHYAIYADSSKTGVIEDTEAMQMHEYRDSKKMTEAIFKYGSVVAAVKAGFYN